MAAATNKPNQTEAEKNEADRLAAEQAEKDKLAAEQAIAAKTAAESKKARAPKAGDKIRLVLANGATAPAIVKSVGKGGLVDLTYGDAEIPITRSPHDPTGKQSDSWHFAGED